ncbi:MAG TPA: AIR synthase-related protein [Candidatus Deferrimicrobiaceae bacterium]
MSFEYLDRFRDPTRGGVGVALNERAETAGRRIVLDEGRLPVRDAVRGVCEILGFDPLYLANEGKALLIVDGEAAAIGEVTEGKAGGVLRTAVGGTRAVDSPVGDQLPRIC